jgi:hypothetical protein
LRIACLDRNGKTLVTKSHLISQTVMPGTILNIPDLAIEGIPAEAITARLSISCADIGRTNSTS